MDKRNHAEQAAAEQIGARIRQRRLEMGMSMQQLSEQLGLNASTIRRYEKEGLSPDKRYLLIALADRLDTDVDWLMGREPEQPGLRTGAYAQYARQLNVRVGQFLQGLKKLDLSGEQQTLLVGVMGCFLDYFSTVAAYYVRALGAAAAPSDREDVFRREMREPVSGLHAMADCLLHLDQPDMQQNFTLLLRSAADGRPLRRGRGSVRQRGGHWYYRFYITDEDGRSVQREFAGGESRWETETMLRRAMADYAQGKRLRTDRLTLGELLDIWIGEMKHSSKSNGTLMLYQGVVNRIKRTLGKRRLRSITTEELQAYLDELCFGSEKTRMLSVGYIRVFQAVLQGAFRYAVYPGKFLAGNPMQYVVRKEKPPEPALFEPQEEKAETLTHREFLALCEMLDGHPALLAVQIAYYTGLRLGEICALTWQDIDLDEQCLTVRRSLRYNGATHRTELSSTKRAKIRTVAFGDTLREILRSAAARHTEPALRCCYRITTEMGRRYYIVEMLPAGAETDGIPLDLVCVKPGGGFLSPDLVEKASKKAAARAGLTDFHFHLLRHTYTTNLLTKGASPKDVQELLGHADVATTMNVYAHSNAEAKRTSARLLDKITESTT